MIIKIIRIIIIIHQMEAEQKRINQLINNYKTVLENLNKSKNSSTFNKPVALAAVSKKRKMEDIKVIYDQGQRIFGENYPQELMEKSAALPKDIEWHLIGHLQSNKVKKLLDTIPNIIIESVDSLKIAKEINKHASNKNKTKVYIEINIGESDSKTGADLKIIDEIADEIINNCKNLELIGIMSLGNVGNKKEFEKMLEIKEKFCDKYNLDKNKFIASFGTSQDFNEAILSGSDEVRVGHQIFEVTE